MIGIAQELGLSQSQIQEGFKKVTLTQMRSNKIAIQKASILDDTYKSNPESAMVALDTLMSIKEKKHIAVLADMLDLGEREKELHEQLGQYATQVGVDIVYGYGPLARYIVKGAGDKGVWFETKDELVAQLKKDIQSPCAIVIKGSRAMKMDQIVVELKGENE